MLNKELLNDAAASCSEVAEMINDLLDTHPRTSQRLHQLSSSCTGDEGFRVLGGGAATSAGSHANT